MKYIIWSTLSCNNFWILPKTHWNIVSICPTKYLQHPLGQHYDYTMTYLAKLHVDRWCHSSAGLIRSVHPAIERCHYKVTPPLIGLAQTYSQPCSVIRWHVRAKINTSVNSDHIFVINRIDYSRKCSLLYSSTGSFLLALKFDRHIGSNAAEMTVKF